MTRRSPNTCWRTGSRSSPRRAISMAPRGEFSFGWSDHDGRKHDLALPRASLAGDGADARRLLLDGGLYVTPNRKGRERLTAFLTSVRSPARVTATSRIGWHKDTFVLPDA